MVGRSSMLILWENSYLCLSDMRFVKDNITDRIKMMPMAVVAALFAVGIVFVEYVALPMWLVIALSLLLLSGAIVVRGAVQRISILLLICSLGMVLHSMTFGGDIPYGKALEMELRITSSSVVRGRSSRAEAVVRRCEENALEGRKVVVWSDTLLHLSAHDRVVLSGEVRPFSDRYEGYAELMRHRGFVGSVSLYSSSPFVLEPAACGSLHDWAVARLRGRIGEGDARAVILAMTTGERSELSPALRHAYSLTGTSHLLAVSGLHIGIVFMLINTLLLPLLMLRYGNVVRSLLAIVLIWLYVLLCGAPPSAIRAAIMFSLLQLSLSSLHSYHSLNVLSATAFMMLMLDSHLVFDISFQLSFIAVAGILLWGVPMYNALRCRLRPLNSIVAVIVVGLVSSVATLPLVSHTFGVVSLVGVLLSPIVILLANVVVLSACVALIMPLPPLLAIAEYAVTLQNRVIAWAQELAWAHFAYTMPEWMVILLYVVFVVLTLLLWGIKVDKRTKIEL